MELTAKFYIQKVDTNDVSHDYSHLTQDELLKLEELSNVSSEKFSRLIDAFLWMCHTGQSHVDTSGMSESQIHAIDDMIMLDGRRGKTKIQYNVVINQKALDLITKYDGIENIPYIHLKVLNEEIKIAQKILGFKVNLSTRVARRTFAQYWYKHTDIPDKFVSKMLGHTKADASKNYTFVGMERRSLKKMIKH